MDFFMSQDPLGAAETVERLRQKIDPFFEVVAEHVKGSHLSGRRLELDAVARPKEALLKDGFANINIGFYLRDPLSGPSGLRDMPRKAKELIDLAHCRYGEFGALPLIVVYPGFFAHLRADQRQRMGEQSGLFERIMAQFNIGELKPEGKNLVLMYHSTRYWDSVFGVNSERGHFTPLL
ncbi:MAG: hypothetical protein WCS37_02875 [Chloroflexota bacterium]